MRALIFTMALLAGCTFNAHGLGDDDGSGSSSSTSVEHYADAKERHPDDPMSTDTGGDENSSGSSGAEGTGSSTGDSEPVSPPYSRCDDPRCGMSKRDVCYSAEGCTWACETVADCGEPPWEGAIVECVPLFGIIEHICRAV